MRFINCMLILISGFLVNVSFSEITTLKGAEYAKRCQTLGVPLPPRWGEKEVGKPKWISNGKMTKSEVFISQEKDAHVYYYSSMGGLCIALPRYDGNDQTIKNVDVFGVICQSSTGKVCFWDSKLPVAIAPETPITIASTSLDAMSNSPFIGGADLAGHNGGMCTDCHRGENPFITMPGTALDLSILGIKNNSGVWYEPIIPAKYGELDWYQNPKGESPIDKVVPPVSQGSCTSCHFSGGQAGKLPPLAKLSDGDFPSYCNAVLMRSRDRGKMPPGGDVHLYSTHWNELAKACATATLASRDIPKPVSKRSSLATKYIIAID